MIDLNSMSLGELKALKKEVDQKINSYSERKRQSALAEMRKVAESHGLTLSDVLGADGRSVQGVPRYRNPNDSSQTWTGKGRKPKWFAEALQAGVTPDKMEI